MDRAPLLKVRFAWQILLFIFLLESASALTWLRATRSPLPEVSVHFIIGAFLALVAGMALAWTIHRLLGTRIARALATVVLGGRILDPRPLTWPWRLGALGAVFSFLALVEWCQPFYFVQDDNWAQFLPVIVQGARAFFNGTMPVWNPHIFGGVPSAEIGIYSLTYPITYLAYGIAQFLGNDLMTLDMFALLHLGAGVLVTQALASRLGMRPSMATLAALSFTLCGFNLMVGRSWYYVLPTALWLPAMLLGLVVLQQRREAPSLRWLVAMGLSIGLLFHAGNAQFWLYALSLMWLVALALVVLKELAAVRLISLLCATVLGIAIASPLLLPQMMTLSVDRGGSGCGIKVGILLDMMLPYPLAGPVPHPCRWPPLTPQAYAGIGYSGTLTTVAAFAGLVFLLAYRTGRRQWAANLWLPVMLTLMIAAIGRSAKLWTVITWLPVFSRFGNPFKLLLFVEFVTALGGGLVLSRLISAMRPAARPWAEGAALVAGSAALFYAGTVSDEPFFRFNKAGPPYAVLPLDIARVLDQPSAEAGQRILSVHAGRDNASSYSLAMPHNTADLYGRYALLGYGDGGFENGLPQVARLFTARDTPAMLQALGVRWVLVHDDFFRPSWPWFYPLEKGTNAKNWSVQTFGHVMSGGLVQARVHGVLKARVGGISLYELPGSAPMVFLGGTEKLGLMPLVDAEGVTVRLPPGHAAGTMTINFIALPRMRAYRDGIPVAIGADGWGRITVPVGSAARQVELRYEPRWAPGWWVALAGAIVSISGFLLAGCLASRSTDRVKAFSNLPKVA